MVARNAPAEEKAAYLRAWKANNVSRVREANRDYARRLRESDPERVREQQRRYYAKNRERRLDATTEWYERMGAHAPCRLRKADQQELTRSRASRAHVAWTPEEDVQAFADLPIVLIAARLGRSRFAVEMRRRLLRKAGSPVTAPETVPVLAPGERTPAQVRDRAGMAGTVLVLAGVVGAALGVAWAWAGGAL